MVSAVIQAAWSDLFAITSLDGSPDPLSAAAGVGIAAIIGLGLIALAVWLWFRS